MTRIRQAVLGAAVLAGLTGGPAAPAGAQNLNDLGRVLQDQVLGGGRQNQDREREAYERGRQDQARERDRDRAYDDRRRSEDDRRRVEDDRRRYDDGRGRDNRRY